MDKKFSTTNLIVLIIIVLIFGYFFIDSSMFIFKGSTLVDGNKEEKDVVTYQDCVDAGNPVMESFPEQCRTKDGLHFVNWRATGESCIQVITPAQNFETGEIREFPTPCDVPFGWNPESITPVFSEDYACNQIIDANFRSVEKLERGLGPDGIILGYWVVGFTKTSFSWGFSDVGVGGSYVCDNGSIEATTDSLSKKINGTYNAYSETLIWDGIEYIKN